MTVKVADVEDIISQLGGADGACPTLPVCLCSYPIEVWEAYHQLFSLVRSRSDLPQLKNILCCLKIGSGTFETPDTADTGTTGKPTGTGGGGTTPEPWDSGLAVPEGTSCANFLTTEFCGLSGKTSLKTLSAALALAELLPEMAEFSPAIDALKNAIDGALAMCDADPSFAGSVALAKVKELCDKLKTFPLATQIPGVGYLGDIPFVTKLMNNCCDKV